MREHTAAGKELPLAVMHADNQVEAAHLQRLAEETWRPTEIFLTDFTPVMGAHTGPGVVGLILCPSA